MLQTSSGSKTHCVVARSKPMFRLMAAKISGWIDHDRREVTLYDVNIWE